MMKWESRAGLSVSMIGVAGVLALLARPAEATDVWFEDFTAKSPNGRYVLEARSPENRKREPEPFADGFRYTFRDTKSRKVLWTKKQEDDDWPYVMGEIHDSGWAVAVDSGDRYHCIAPDGRQAGTVELLGAGFGKADAKRYVKESSVGPMWRAMVVEYFLLLDGRLHYAVRPWWGRRVLIDVHGGAVVKISREAEAACLRRESEEAMRMLRKAVAGKKTIEGDCCGSLAGSARHGAFLAGALGLREAVPLLRKLEDSRSIGSSTSTFESRHEALNGVLLVDSYQEYSVREAVHLSLRKLGEIPGPFAILQPSLHSGKSFKTRYAKFPVLPAPRHELAAKVRAGQTPEEVFALLSGPDFIDSSDRERVAWEYDMDAERPYTLRIVWEKRKVARVKRVRPAVWQEKLKREDQFIW